MPTFFFTDKVCQKRLFALETSKNMLQDFRKGQKRMNLNMFLVTLLKFDRI